MNFIYIGIEKSLYRDLEMQKWGNREEGQTELVLSVALSVLGKVPCQPCASCQAGGCTEHWWIPGVDFREAFERINWLQFQQARPLGFQNTVRMSIFWFIGSVAFWFCNPKSEKKFCFIVSYTWLRMSLEVQSVLYCKMLWNWAA